MATPTLTDRLKDLAEKAAPAAEGLGAIGGGVGGFIEGKNVEEWGRKQQQQANYEYAKQERQVRHGIDQANEKARLLELQVPTYDARQAQLRGLMTDQNRRVGELEDIATREKSIATTENEVRVILGQVEKLDAATKAQAAIITAQQVEMETQASIEKIQEEMERTQGAALARAGAAGLVVGTGSVGVEQSEIERIGNRELRITEARGKAQVLLAEGRRDMAVAMAETIDAKVNAEVERARLDADKRYESLKWEADRTRHARATTAIDIIRTGISKETARAEAVHARQAAAHGEWSLTARPGVPNYEAMAKREARALRLSGGIKAVSGSIAAIGAAPGIISAVGSLAKPAYDAIKSKGSCLISNWNKPWKCL